VAKKRLTDISNDMNLEFNQAYNIVVSVLEEDMVSGTGKNTWIDERGQLILAEYEVVPEITSKVFDARCIKKCNNDRYWYVLIPTIGKVPALVPKLLRNNMAERKNVKIELIEDDTGKSYRIFKPRLYEQ
tara:strand:+ start:2425 stop:2814 length:390 start_codon:yes stop_codon:yes gene_type:complete